jgi:hypothetical protein
MPPPDTRKPVSAVADNRPPKVVRLGGGTAEGTSNNVVLLAQARESRRRLDEGLDLIREGLDLRERLWMQIDLDEARRQVADFNRAIAGFLAARNERGRRP